MCQPEVWALTGLCLALEAPCPRGIIPVLKLSLMMMTAMIYLKVLGVWVLFAGVALA